MTPEHTATATLKRSVLAESLHFDALRLVAWESRDAAWPWDENYSARYRSAVGRIAQRRMLEELEPINKSLASLAAMSLEPFHAPGEVEAMRQGICDKWAGVVSELLK
jgi:hypothetical protein